MKREIRNSARALTDEMTRELLERGEFGVLSTVSKDGEPYGVPMSYAFADGKVYLHCAREGHKLDNITDTPQVCFTVVGDTEVLPEKFSTKYKSAIVFGRAEVLEDSEEKMKGILALMGKYSADFLEEGRAYAERAFAKFKVIKIVPEYISGKGRLS
ncbi:MAG: pyridoxamine 5'-phosphate oxidase family protein [Lachnospiraceae bacterium]|nr:pyridoxamine 5'-phosphate oxidase family protein [Lachnospiraceae bacterium]